MTAYAPLRVSDAAIRGFVEAKRGWLRAHLTEQQERPQPAALTDDAQVLFLGERLTLRLAEVAAVRRDGEFLWLPREKAEEALTAWTQAAALPIYTELVRGYAQALGAGERLRSVRVSNTRSRWGSCTAAGDIRLHWALTRAPLEVLRYVALHEAAHLLELNHSPRYWQHVARLMPAHEAQRRWLREHGEGLAAGLGYRPAPQG